MSINIVHVVRQFMPSIGGMEDVVSNIATLQLEAGTFTPTVLTLNRLFTHSNNTLPITEKLNGIKIVRIPFFGSSRYPISLKALKYICSADLVHVHGIDFFFDYFALTKLLHRRRLLVSTHGGFFHSDYASSFKNFYFNSITRTSAIAYDNVIATSENDSDIFSKVISPKKLITIENGVNIHKYRRVSSNILTQNLLYFGRWSSNKALDKTLSVFRSLVNTQPQWRLTIAGREYDETVSSLSKIVRQHELDDFVTLIPNPTEEILSSLISDASFFICLSRHEGFGLAAIEAMSAGLTPILSDIPPFRRLVEKSSTGAVINPNEIESATADIFKLYDRIKNNYIENQRSMERYVQQYDWREVVKKYTAVYEHALAEKSR